MKKLLRILQVIQYCMGHALLRPRTDIPPGGNPLTESQSPIPWWGSAAVIMLGIFCWVGGASWGVTGLDEAGRVLVYVPMGHIFGLSQRSK